MKTLNESINEDNTDVYFRKLKKKLIDKQVRLIKNENPHNREYLIKKMIKLELTKDLSEFVKKYIKITGDSKKDLPIDLRKYVGESVK